MVPREFRLISWNIAGKVGKNPQQMAALAERQPDLLALQEVRLNALTRIKPRLADMALPHLIESVHLATKYDRRYGEVIASRWPLQEVHFTDKNAPFPERVISVSVDTPWGSIELHTAHIVPGVSNGYRKIGMFEDIYVRLAHHPQLPRILCGDFNTPQGETPEGRVITWGEEIRSDGRIAISRGDERWDAGERSILQGLAPFDLPDVFRALNGYEVEAYSWFHKTKYGVTKRRFDHVFASQALNAVECRYLTHLVEDGLSDHAAIEAVFQPS
ncbi:MAG: endonuclease/exonuclease/phosphatase family protein [Anaerolineae bacterium]